MKIQKITLKDLLYEETKRFLFMLYPFIDYNFQIIEKNEVWYYHIRTEHGGIIIPISKEDLIKFVENPNLLPIRKESTLRMLARIFTQDDTVSERPSDERVGLTIVICNSSSKKQMTLKERVRGLIKCLSFWE